MKRAAETIQTANRVPLFASIADTMAVNDKTMSHIQIVSIWNKWFAFHRHDFGLQTDFRAKHTLLTHNKHGRFAVWLTRNALVHSASATGPPESDRRIQTRKNAGLVIQVCYAILPFEQNMGDPPQLSLSQNSPFSSGAEESSWTHCFGYAMRMWMKFVMCWWRTYANVARRRLPSSLEWYATICCQWLWTSASMPAQLRFAPPTGIPATIRHQLRKSICHNPRNFCFALLNWRSSSLPPAL